MAGKKLVIVESPTKAKTISKFLDSSYMVESCMGHIRDLPESAKDIPEKYKDKSWKNLGVNVDEKFQPIYCIPKSKLKVVSNLKNKLKQADELILATDEDREGESISWHLHEILKPKVPVKRIVFHEITKEAILNSLKNFRKVDENLVQAQEARRVLDRLVGYTISPLLWKKIAMGLSAGRVQSTAVKLISEREMERYHFVEIPYCGLKADFLAKKVSFPAKIYSVKSQKIAEGKDFDDKGVLKNKKLLHLNQKQATSLEKSLKTKTWTVEQVDKKAISRSPKPPFITSTLQQVANRKLGLSPRQAMSAAQKLYENGLITYMRTDSTSLSQQAISGIRKTVTNLYGKNELSPTERIYKTKSKGAQEAHEAIRPAGKTFKPPSSTGLIGVELRLYELIWQRTLACQMKNCEQEQTSIKISTSSLTVFSASGTVIISPGFYRVYKDSDSLGEQSMLPALKKGDKVNCESMEITKHQTMPPSRYNEASLIQKLEKEGVGRPSTYAPIISTIQDRGYVKKVNKTLIPTFTALAVTNLLSKYLPNYVDLKFTSTMEDSLDELAIGKTNYNKYLSSIYKGKSGLKESVAKQEKDIDTKQSRVMHFDKFKGFTFHVGKFGAYISQKKGEKEVTASLPQDTSLSDITIEILDNIIKTKNEPEHIGLDPKTKKKIFIKTGRYGPYLELGDGEKRSSIPKFIPVSELTLEQAVQLIELPKVLGLHPKTKKEIKKSIGRFGPYVVHDGDFRSVPSNESFLSLDLKQSLEILAKEKTKGRRGSQSVKEFKHKNSTIKVMKGRFSPYLNYKNRNYSLGKDVDPDNVDLQQCLDVLDGKTSKSKKQASVKKTAAKKTPSKKTAAKKTTSAKTKRKVAVKKTAKTSKKS